MGNQNSSMKEAHSRTAILSLVPRTRVLLILAPLGSRRSHYVWMYPACRASCTRGSRHVRLSAAGVGGAGGPSGPAAFIQLDVADAVGIAPLLELMPPLSAQALGLDPWVRHAPTGPRLGDPG